MNEVAMPLQAAGDGWTISGPMTMDSVASLLRASRSLPMPPSGIVDLKRVDRVDSAGVSVLLAWKRRALAQGSSLHFAGLPQSVISLALLYGVEEMLTD